MQTPLILDVDSIPGQKGWLNEQPAPVIGVGDWGATLNADVIVAEQAEAEKLSRQIQQRPQASLILVQVLRASENLPVSQALDIESLAYSTLQSGSEFKSWLANYKSPSPAPSEAEEAIVVSRQGDALQGMLNRPSSRNAITIEMRDALVALLEVVALDQTVTELTISAAGACFSVGGELREFGTAPDAATAHWVRTVHSPARLLARVADKVVCRVHGACIGSGIELPAFAGKVCAHKKTFFQLPELQLGLIPGAGGTVSIARRIGRQRLAWLVLTGRRINAKTAREWGLVDTLFD